MSEGQVQFRLGYQNSSQRFGDTDELIRVDYFFRLTTYAKIFARIYYEINAFLQGLGKRDIERSSSMLELHEGATSGKGLTRCVRDLLLLDLRTSSMMPRRLYHTPQSG